MHFGPEYWSRYIFRCVRCARCNDPFFRSVGRDIKDRLNANIPTHASTHEHTYTGRNESSFWATKGECDASSDLQWVVPTKKKKIKQKKISHNDVTKWQRTHIPLQPVCVCLCATVMAAWQLRQPLEQKKKIGNSFMSRIVKNIISIFYVCRRRHVANMVLRFYCFVAPPNTPRILRCWNVGIFDFWQLNQPKVPSLFFKWQRELDSKGEQIPSICVAYACICLYILNLNRDRSVS